MSRLPKVALVALGYAAALALACGAVAARVAADPADASGGMQAFGDALAVVSRVRHPQPVAHRRRAVTGCAGIRASGTPWPV